MRQDDMQLTIKSRLIITIVFLASILIVIGAKGNYALSDVNDALKTVYEDRVVPLQQLKVISDHYAVSVIDAVNKANAGLTSGQDALELVETAAHEIDVEWQKYMSTTLTEQEQTLAYLRRTGRPAIVIAASGMCTGGRMVNYLRALLPDPRTDVLFVGYQARGTAGRDIQTYGPRGGYVLLDGERVDIRAGVHTLSGYSAHADQQDLLNFVKRMRHKPKHIRIVHGDTEAKQTLQRLYQDLLPECEVVIG
jgi:metallo-beta-lactamase family protein